MKFLHSFTEKTLALAFFIHFQGGGVEFQGGGTLKFRGGEKF